MTVTTEPEALLSHLPKADGSATYSYAGYTIIGAVNGPIEVQRRDELPEEAAVDVVVRPAAGAGGTRERHLELLLQSTLRQIILVDNFPRTLIQIVLQVAVAPENEYVNAKVVQPSSNLPMLPALLQTAVLSLLSAALPLAATITSTSLAITTEDGAQNIIVDPSAREIEKAASFHVFAFTSYNELILAESQGNFDLKDWEGLYSKAFHQCCPLHATTDNDIDMDDEGHDGANLKHFTKSTLEAKVASDLHWK